MATSQAYTDRIMALLGRFHPLTYRKMFGGIGIYSAESDSILAMISSADVLYLKVDEVNRADYEAIDAEQFHRMPYFRLPDSIIEDDEQLQVWLEKSVAVAARAPKKKKK